MIKNLIKVRLLPPQGINVNLKTTYLYDSDWIPEINNGITDAHNYAEIAKESSEIAKESSERAEADALAAFNSRQNADRSAEIARAASDGAKKRADEALNYSLDARDEANASAESAYQSQQSALAAHEYAQNASSDAENALETLEHVLASETNARNSAAEASESARQAKEIKESISNVYKFKGSVNTYTDLPTTGLETGDVYDVIDSGINYAWTGSQWDALGGSVGGGDVDLTGYLKNTATGDYSISVLGTPSDQAYAINMGVGTTSAADGVAIGHTAGAAGEKSLAIGTSVIANGLGSITLGYSTRHISGDHGIAIGYNAQTAGENAIQLGQGINSTANTFQVGNYRMLDANGKIPAERLPDDIGGDVDLTGYLKNTSGSSSGLSIDAGDTANYVSGNGGIAIGASAPTGVVQASTQSVAIGTYANASGNYGVSIGSSSAATGQFSVGLGYAAKSTGKNAIQIGQGTNATANTLKVGLASNKNYTLLNSDGTIPAERLVNAPAPDVSLPITNCITEIPQNVKLELNNGVLTLKSGSIIYYPNGKSSGTNVFTYVTTSVDRTLTLTTAPSKDTQMLICCHTSGALNANFIQPLDKCFTVDTNPSETPFLVYNTTTNRCNYNGQTAVTFPIAIITQGSDGVTKSIDQVFNGFGFIGSTVFALPGVKGLIPDGRNEDGTLKNVETTNDKVLTYTGSVPRNMASLGFDKTNLSPQNILLYDVERNINLSGGTNPVQLVNVATWSADNTGVITSFRPKTTFHAVDYNDFEKLDDEAVKTIGNQTIAGEKSFTTVNGLKAVTSGSNNIVIKNTDLDASESSRTTPSASSFSIYDKNDKIGGMFNATFNTNGTNQARMQIRNYANGSQVTGEISVSVDENGSVYTSAPTPASAIDNSTRIATTAWVRNHRCTTAATTTSTASVDAPAYVIQNYRIGNSWYRVWSDGWIEQGGLTQSADSALTASFPKAFTTTNYTLLISTHTGCRLISEITRATTNFTGKQYNVSSGTYINENKLYAWYACGY